MDEEADWPDGWWCVDCEVYNQSWVGFCPICGAPDRVRPQVRSPDAVAAPGSAGRSTRKAHQSQVRQRLIDGSKRRLSTPADTAKNVSWALLGGQVILKDQDDSASDTSTTSDTRDSVFSVESLGTSATVLSKQGGFSPEQIQSATRVFISILQDDELLAPLYEVARNNTKIGSNRLRRHIRGALKAYAENLKEEANDHLEFQASRLVDARAGYAARCIASGKDQHHRPPIPGRARDQASENFEDSSEEEAMERPVEVTDLGDLQAFRVFLTKSDAYATLQLDLHAFFTKFPITSQNTSALHQPKLVPAHECNMKCTWHLWQKDTKILASSLLLGFDRLLGAKASTFLLLDIVFLLTDDMFIALGLLEPPLEVGWTRIRSECSSGDRFFDDFIELRTNGIANLVRDMQRSLPGLEMTIVSHNVGFVVQQYTARVSTWLQRITSSVLSALSWHNRNSVGLPHHNVGGTVTTTSTTPPSNPQQHINTVHLMSCVHRSRNDPVLLPIDAHTIRNDQALFTLLRARIVQRRNCFMRILSCRSIQGTFFTKFQLHSNNHVDIRNHVQSCSSTASRTSYCDCLPPVQIVEPFPNAEYRCHIPLST